MALCASCKRFDIQAFFKSSSGRRGFRLDRVLESARNGCSFCSLITVGASKLGASDQWIHLTLCKSQTRDISKMTLIGPQQGVNRLRLEQGRRHFDMDLVPSVSAVELIVAADPDSPAAKSGDVSGRFLGQNTSADVYFNSIRKLIDNCLQHSKCKESASGKEFDAHNVELPTRCIETSQNRLFLRETKGIPGSYMTLSHRWGNGTDACKTTMENYHERLNGNGFHNLPKNFEHAIDVAGRLGVRYIWIDSICIIQDGDDGKDFKREVSEMARYYQHAIVTVSGTGNAETDGLYSDRIHNLPVNIVQLPYCDKSGSQRGTFYVYRTEKKVLQNFEDAVRKSELFQRGWVFQEWILSRRFLLFTSSGIFLECQSECPRSADGDVLDPTINGGADAIAAHLKLSFHISTTSPEEFWYKVLEQYAPLDLTNPHEDRIRALSGVASEYRDTMTARAKDQSGVVTLEYASGLWVHDIHYGLLWEPKNAGKPGAEACNAPSWSWAARSGAVKWPERSQFTYKSFRILKLAASISSSAVWHPIPDQTLVPSWKSMFSRSSKELSIPEEFGVENMFTCLLISGRLQPVVIRGKLDAGSPDADFVATATGCQMSDLIDRWIICSPSSREIMGGWTTLENDDLESHLCSFKTIVLYALHVSTRKWAGLHGVALGSFLPRNDIYDVLLLDCVEENIYRRCGVGRIFEVDLIQNFKNAASQEIKLI